VSAPLRVVLVSGLSGSGKSTAIHALEDLGYYCIDNLPAALLPRFIELCERSDEVSRAGLGVDSRGREFLDELPRALDEIRRQGHRLEVMFLEASDDTLVRRFSETRRPHPMGEGSDLSAAIRREREKLAWLREHADRIVDTSTLTGHELRAAVRGLFEHDAAGQGLRVTLLSFGFKHGLPADADLVWDVRFLPNPFYVEDLRPLTGREEAVARYVLAKPESARFLEIVGEFLRFALPAYEREGKSYLTIAIGCTGGRHRSVVLVQSLARMLKEMGTDVVIRHRDVER
jgi:UPF0042 nucleotide-binding protein